MKKFSSSSVCVCQLQLSHTFGNRILWWCDVCVVFLLWSIIRYQGNGETVVLRWGQQWTHLMSSACPSWENCTWCQRLSKSYVVYLFKTKYCFFFIWWDCFFYLSVPNQSHCLQIKYQVLFMHTRLPTGSAFYGIHLVVLFHPSSKSFHLNWK